MKVLNYTGLQNLWTNIKNFITAHTSDTTIHVTANDKEKWNTLALIKHLRLVNAQVGSATTIPFSDFDDTNGIKVGDKCADLDVKVFEITAVDTTNETVTVSPLLDIALDANVVHTSGNETVGGEKTFADYITSDGSNIGDEYTSNALTNLWLMGKQDTEDVSGVLFDTYRQNTTQGTGVHILGISIKENSVRYEGCRFGWYWDSNLNGYEFNFRPTTQGTNQAVQHNLGTSVDKWSNIFGLKYYYGSTAVEFSDKFVTTDTAQDIEGDKNFKGLLTTIPDGTIWPVTANTTDDITYLGANAIHVEQKSSGKLTDLSNGAWSVAELGVGCFFFRINNGTDIRYKHLGQNTVNRIPVVSGANRFMNDVLPDQDNTYSLGSSSLKWKTINNISPGALSFPDLSSGLDISSYITDLTGASNINKFTPTVDGWISIGIPDAEFIELYVPTLLMGGTFTKSTANNNAQAFMPVVANKEVKIALKGSSVGWAKFFPNLGNV